MFKQVRTDFASWIDLHTGRPVVGRVVETAGKERRLDRDRPSPVQRRARRLLPLAIRPRRDRDRRSKTKVIAGDTVWDVPSMLMFLAGWGARPRTELHRQVVRSR